MSDTTAASISQVNDAINAAAKGSGFRCTPVSWEDAQRGTVDGALSCWGGNISDVRLWEKTGKLLYTCRSDNWNERIGYVSAKDVAVVVGNHAPGGSPATATTLHNVLSNAGAYLGYAGLRSDNLLQESTDEIMSIRFQTVFLPVATSDDAANSKLQFCTEVYNYNTRDDADPRNLLLLCTSQGTSVQQDGSGAKKLFLHEVDPEGAVHRYWLEGEASKHKVGGSQTETAEEREAAVRQGKATAMHIGTRAMGTRFNVQMMLQLPVKQTNPDQGGGGWDYDDDCLCECAMNCEMADEDDDDDGICYARCEESSAPPPRTGKSTAARVSRGSEEDVWPGVARPEVERDPSMHGTITVTMYYTVSGGVPSADDVKAAITDLDALYKGCPSERRLAQASEITSELTPGQLNGIAEKIVTQPYGAQPTQPVDEAQ